MSRPVKEAPTLYPSEEDFKDFSKYVADIRRSFRHCGIVKVVPPASWKSRKTEINCDDLIIPAAIEQVFTGQQGISSVMNLEQNPMTVKEFRELATQKAIDARTHDVSDPLELERKFWRSLCFSPSLYGADMEGTFFDEDVKDWNLQRLSTILDVLGVEMSGITTPFLYFGMWKSCFAWHVEDMDLYSINYVHFGAPKFWYGVPSEHAKKFEEVAKAHFPSEWKECKQFLRHKTTMISPSILTKNNITMNYVVQQPGEFVITFPLSYHAGFNTGFNCAEAVNFALEDWIPFGKKCKRCLCDAERATINMDHFLYMYEMATYGESITNPDYDPNAPPPPIPAPVPRNRPKKVNSGVGVPEAESSLILSEEGASVATAEFVFCLDGKPVDMTGKQKRGRKRKPDSGGIVFSPQTPQKGSFGVPTINTTPFTNGSRKLRVTLGGMAYGALSPEEEELRRAEMQYEQAKRYYEAMARQQQMMRMQAAQSYAYMQRYPTQYQQPHYYYQQPQPQTQPRPQQQHMPPPPQQNPNNTAQWYSAYGSPQPQTHQQPPPQQSRPFIHEGSEHYRHQEVSEQQQQHVANMHSESFGIESTQPKQQPTTTQYSSLLSDGADESNTSVSTPTADSPTRPALSPHSSPPPLHAPPALAPFNISPAPQQHQHQQAAPLQDPQQQRKLTQHLNLVPTQENKIKYQKLKVTPPVKEHGLKWHNMSPEGSQATMSGGGVDDVLAVVQFIPADVNTAC